MLFMHIQRQTWKKEERLPLPNSFKLFADMLPIALAIRFLFLCWLSAKVVFCAQKPSTFLAMWPFLS